MNSQYSGKVTLYTNCFELKSKSNWDLYQYNVTFKPDIESINLKSKLFERNSKKYFPQNCIFSGNTAYSTNLIKKLTIETTDHLGNPLNINIEMIKKIDFDLKNPQIFIGILNIIYKK